MLKDFLEGKSLGHPIHPMLVHFPIGLFFLSLLLDIASFVFSNVPGLVLASFYSILLGVITALLAAVPGFADYTDIRRDHPAKRIATAHMILNLIVVTLYVINLAVRFSADVDLKVHPLAFLLSLFGVAFLSVSGYLGGRLVYDDGIGVGRHKRHMPAPRDTIHLTAPIPGADSVFVPIMAAQQLRERETLRVEIDGQIMAIAKIDNQLFAFQEFCTHRFGPLSEGKFEGFNVQCPWHNSCFDVRTGKVTDGPAKVDLKIFKVEMREGKVGIVLPREAKSA
jgi:uncharacterized membrane protein/nitrite reductase/ring-hydroxylating ferredoxin subunit